ncbi:hypothetical protein KKH36_02960 [Patescibacteria group bacterium]|nr:hypothetical protein [Patescibacteria group bacterium]
MSWSSERKNKYLFLMFSIILVIVGFFSYSIFYTAPTCTDGKLNQGEEGIDCGGPCEIICSFKTIDPIIKWSRAVETTEGIFGAVALIENANTYAEADKVPYVFKLYDKEGLLINEKRGEVYILNNSIFPIFEGNLKVGNRIPTRATFEFLKKPQWVETKELNAPVTLSNIQYVERNNSPRVSATIKNNSVKDIKKVELIVLLYDIENNLVNSSKTTLDVLKKDSSEIVIFTWPDLFEKEVIKIDIVPVSKLH